MIERLRRGWFTVRYAYGSTLIQQRAARLLLMNWANLLGWAVALALGSSSRAGQPIEITLASNAVVPVLTLVVFALVQRGRIQIAIWIFFASLIVSVAPAILAEVAFQPSVSTTILLAIPLVAAGLLLGRRGLIAASLLVAVVAVLRGVAQGLSVDPVTVIPAAQATTDTGLTLISLGLVALFLYIATATDTTLDRTLIETDRVQAITAQISRLGTTDNERLILTKTLDLLRDDAGYTSAHLYLLKTDGSINRHLRAGLGMNQSGEYMAPADSKALIMRVAQERRPLVIKRNDEHSAHLSPPARTGALVPLIQNDQVVGVLDAQTTHYDLSARELAALRTVADQLGALAFHAHTTTELRTALRDQEQLVTGLQTQVRELRQGAQQVVTGGWAQYIEGRGRRAIGFDMERENDTLELTPAQDDTSLPLPSHITETTVTMEGDEQIVNVPIMVRGQHLGSMSFALPNNQPLTELQFDLLNTMSSRLGLALENTRLFEQSQVQALRERKASEVASTLIAATDVRAVLNLAAEGFNEALGAIYTRIHLEPEAVAKTRSEEA